MAEGWLRAQLSVSDGLAEAVADWLEEQGATAVSLEDAKDQPLLEPPPGAMPLWQEVVVSGLFPFDDALAPRLREALAAWQVAEGQSLPPLAMTPLEEADWVRAWVQFAVPLRFGDRLAVVPVDDRGVAVAPQAGTTAAEVRLAPGLAFGTGGHATTRQCLAAVAEWAWAGETVLDFGCGSGVLALAALLCGAGGAVAVDHDPQALAATRHNGVENGVADRLLVTDAVPAGARFDALLANVLAGPLVSLAPELLKTLKPGALVVLSGILPPQAEAVAQAWVGVDFEYREADGGVCLMGPASAQGEEVSHG
jgi:ribosomal protein L11 methyltransferase